MDIQRTKESTAGCQRSSSKQADVFEAFSPAMAGESHGRAARGGIFGDAVQVVDGVLSGGQMGGAWRSNGPPSAFFLRRAESLRRAGREGGARCGEAISLTTVLLLYTFQ